MEALARDLREKLRISGPYAKEMFILHRDAGRNQTLGMVGRELLVEVSIPAQLRQVHRSVLIVSPFPEHCSIIGQAPLGRFEFRKPAAFLLDQVILDATDGFRRGKELFPGRHALTEQDAIAFLFRSEEHTSEL